jgi:tripeptide aminopeptidase
MINPLLLETLKVQSHTYECDKMIDFVLEKLFELGCWIDYDAAGNIYAVKGESDTYPCIVAHLDTVHKIVPDNQYVVISDDDYAFAYNPVKKEMTGVGGDDKVGIYIALQMMRDLDYCKAAFFVDEEVGCLGSSQANMDFFQDVRFALQCDRKGNNDFVYNIMGTSLYTEQFSNDIAPIIAAHGYSENTGGLTDVYQLADNGIGVCVANMSCGYYNPHTDEEMICLSDVENCRRMVYEIMTKCTNVYECTHERHRYDSWWKDGGNGVSYKKDSKKDESLDWHYPDWSDWEYKDGKYTITDSQWKACWDCYEVFNKDKINGDGLCSKCSAYHDPKII